VEQTAVADVMNQTFKKVQGSEWEWMPLKRMEQAGYY
jgi:hypothetical protein